MQYLRHIVDIGNTKLRENLERVERYKYGDNTKMCVFVCRFHQQLVGTNKSQKMVSVDSREGTKPQRHRVKKSASRCMTEEDSTIDFTSDVANLFS